MPEALVSGILAGYGMAMPVGGITVLILTLSAQTSLHTGFAGAMGTATADGLFALIAVLAGAAVATVIEPIAVPMRWIAAAVLVLIAARGVYSAVRSARASADGRTLQAKKPLRAYLELLGLTMLNPLTIVYFSALVIGGHSGHWAAIDNVVFVVAAFAASASWQTLLAVGGSLVGRLFTSPRGRLGTALVGNGVILFLVVRLLTS